MYKILVNIFGLITRLKLDIKTEGQRNLPTEGPVLIIFNHNDFLDTVVMLLAIPRKMTAFVAYEYRYNPAVILFNAAGSVILVRRGQGDTKALAQGLSHLKKGGGLNSRPGRYSWSYQSNGQRQVWSGVSGRQGRMCCSSGRY